MDPVRIPETPDPLPRGPSLFIPYDCFNIQKNGKHDTKLALDLPPQKTHHEAKVFITSQRLLGRAVNYVEYSVTEIMHNEEILRYMGLWKGRY